MGFKMQEFQCQDCQHEFELLLRTGDGAEQEPITCPNVIPKAGKRPKKAVELVCGSENVKPILAVGTGNKTHVSWSKWSV